MNKSDVTYVFYGNECEYNLAPLAKYMKENGYSTVEFSNVVYDNCLDILKDLKKVNTVFINSWHLFFDYDTAHNYHKLGENKTILSPLEVMNYIKPIKSYFYPHDLVCLFHKHERNWLDLFDGIFFPYKHNDYYLLKDLTNTYEVGWMKKISPIKSRENSNDVRILFLPSTVNLNYTPKQHVKIYQDVYSKCHGIKYHFSETCRQYSDACKDAGLPIIDPRKNIFELFDEYDVIVSNSTSSVIFEAGFNGKTVITYYDTNPYLIDDIPDYPWLTKIKYDNLLPYLDDIKSKTIPLYRGVENMKQFDFKLVEKIISQ